MTFSTLSGNKLSGVPATADFSNTSTGTYTGYKYVTFAASGSLVVTRAGFADIVILAGGGGGGPANAYSGGGAGGLLQVTNAYLPIGTFTVTVGAGGVVGNNGIASRISDYLVPGGGSGGTSGLPGYNGGSGGGAGGYQNGVGGVHPASLTHHCPLRLALDGRL